MLTSTNLAGESQAARDCGIGACLTKPVRAAQVRTTLVHLLADAAAVAGADAVTAETTGPIAAEPGRPTASGRILVAEDNEVNQQVVIEMLVGLGYQADVAGDGEQAIRMLHDRPYGAVLMDCQMPVLDGYQATERIRRLDPPLNAVPIIALTASALASDKHRCLAVGMNEFLSKPVRKQQLDAALHRFLAASARSPSSDAVAPQSVDSQATATPAGSDETTLLDPAAVEELREMGSPFLNRLLPRYLRNATDAAAAISAAAARRHMAELARLAHKLSGSSGTMAGHRLAATCKALQEAAEAEDLTAVSTLALTVERQTAATCQALRASLIAG